MLIKILLFPFVLIIELITIIMIVLPMIIVGKIYEKTGIQVFEYIYKFLYKLSDSISDFLYGTLLG